MKVCVKLTSGKQTCPITVATPTPNMIWVDSITGTNTITLDISFSVFLGTRLSARDACSETLNLRAGKLDPEASKKRGG